MSDELILSVAGEGGGYRLFGTRDEDSWRFFSKRNESVMGELLDEEDNDLQPFLETQSSDMDADLFGALEQIRGNWYRLNPKFIHPLFALDILHFLHRKNGVDLEKWRSAIFNHNPIIEAAKQIKQSKRLVVLTGAGMSVDSGVNDFRSRSGWWRQIDPQTIANVEALENNYELFHAFYKMRIEQLELIKPHAGHDVLWKWEKEGKLKLISTQNVDGLHQRAGNRFVEELHGSILSYRCYQCGKGASKSQFLDREVCSCGGFLRPNVVLFGESLPQQAWENSLRFIEEADVVLVIGTSLQVYPASQLPTLTKGRTILLNHEMIEAQNRFDTVIIGRALDCIVEIDRWMNADDL